MNSLVIPNFIVSVDVENQISILYEPRYVDIESGGWWSDERRVFDPHGYEEKPGLYFADYVLECSYSEWSGEYNSIGGFDNFRKITVQDLEDVQKEILEEENETEIETVEFSEFTD